MISATFGRLLNGLRCFTVTNIDARAGGLGGAAALGVCYRQFFWQKLKVRQRSIEENFKKYFENRKTRSESHEMNLS